MDREGEGNGVVGEGKRRVWRGAWRKERNGNGWEGKG